MGRVPIMRSATPFVAVFLTVNVAVVFCPDLSGPEVFVGWGDDRVGARVKVAVTVTLLFMVMVQVDCSGAG